MPTATNPDDYGDVVFSRRYSFATWPNPELPANSAGVYLIWEDAELMYCGIAGRRASGDVSNRPSSGLKGRLSSHRSGRLSGDQFCVYVASQLVVPQLRPEQIAKLANRSLTLDALTKSYIEARMDYQFAATGTYSRATAYESACCSGMIAGMRPRLNPHDAARRIPG